MIRYIVWHIKSCINFFRLLSGKNTTISAIGDGGPNSLSVWWKDYISCNLLQSSWSCPQFHHASEILMPWLFPRSFQHLIKTWRTETSHTFPHSLWTSCVSVDYWRFPHLWSSYTQRVFCIVKMWPLCNLRVLVFP